MSRIAKFVVTPLLGVALVSCSKKTPQVVAPTVTQSPAEALKNVVSSNDPECELQNRSLTPTTAGPTTTRAPLPGQTTAAPTTTAAPKPLDPVAEYVRFGSRVAVRKTQFENLVQENQAFASQLSPIAKAYGEASQIVQTQVLPAARTGNLATLALALDSAEVQVSSAAVLAEGLGFKFCSTPIPVPRVDVPAAPPKK